MKTLQSWSKIQESPYSNPMVEKALEKGIPVLTEVELAYLISDAPIIGITGSNGKTTTTTMIGEVLTAAGQGGLLSGNIGFPASQVAQTATEKDVLVMELSSFQLMGIEVFHPEICSDYQPHADPYPTIMVLLKIM